MLLQHCCIKKNHSIPEKLFYVYYFWPIWGVRVIEQSVYIFKSLWAYFHLHFSSNNVWFFEKKYFTLAPLNNWLIRFKRGDKNGNNNVEKLYLLLLVWLHHHQKPFPGSKCHELQVQILRTTVNIYSMCFFYLRNENCH